MAASNCKKMLSVGMNFSIRWQWFVDSSPILAREVEDEMISIKADILRKFMLEHFDITQVHETLGNSNTRLLTQGGHMDWIGGTIRGFYSTKKPLHFQNQMDGLGMNPLNVCEVNHGTDTPAESSINFV